jgi:hypothetical protein
MEIIVLKNGQKGKKINVIIMGDDNEDTTYVNPICVFGG